jgi:serine phosphatase RsbU (regulator of sigma subunit)
MLKTIMDAVLAYRGETPQSDDITMVAFTRTE